MAKYATLLLIMISGIALVRAAEPPEALRSLRGDTSTFIRFTNHTHQVVRVDWIDYGGHLVRYHTLEPGISVLQQTYVTHPWVGSTVSGSRYPVTIADGSGTQEVVFTDGDEMVSDLPHGNG
jgi:VHL beta domain